MDMSHWDTRGESSVAARPIRSLCWTTDLPRPAPNWTRPGVRPLDMPHWDSSAPGVVADPRCTVHPWVVDLSSSCLRSRWSSSGRSEMGLPLDRRLRPGSAPGDGRIWRRDRLGGRWDQPAQRERASVSAASLGADHGVLEPRAAAPPPVAVQRLPTEHESTTGASPAVRAVGVRSDRVVQLVRSQTLGKGLLQAVPSTRARGLRAAHRQASTPNRDAAAALRLARHGIDVQGRPVLYAAAHRLESVTAGVAAGRVDAR
jgi:hypothetical protein